MGDDEKKVRRRRWIVVQSTYTNVLAKEKGTTDRFGKSDGEESEVRERVSVMDRSIRFERRFLGWLKA